MSSSLPMVRMIQEIPTPEALESPLPGGLARLVRFFLDFPQPLQIAGVVVGAVVALLVVGLLWRRRAALIPWVRTRPRIVYAWTGGVGAALVIVGGSASFMGWNYVQPAAPSMGTMPIQTPAPASSAQPTSGPSASPR